jgi:hypothetical protein
MKHADAFLLSWIGLRVSFRTDTAYRLAIYFELMGRGDINSCVSPLSSMREEEGTVTSTAVPRS